ncbi:hypothetical protein [Spirosoma foliorum]|uniref:Uncharacterized protein n=1 Tax=Spirosoma foliorum TaxID=2710596 RepID=A0A7G5H6N0_9BACT|nr:hypothetical protein [Spirosoma foliorum]QMW06772.1 hypothetical protein H3H32_18700 [Spirosoma foliorum]
MRHYDLPRQSTRNCFGNRGGDEMSRSVGAVTNAADVIATEVVKRYGLSPERMLFVDRTADAALLRRTAP